MDELGKIKGKAYIQNSSSKKNWKGKEYDKYRRKLIFEGAYLNRKKRKLIRINNYIRYLIFECEYKNGSEKKWKRILWW